MSPMTLLPKPWNGSGLVAVVQPACQLVCDEQAARH
jgi:hypothetical protein